MNDRILFRSDSLTDAAAELNKLIEALEDVSSGLSRVNTSEDWWSSVSVRTSHGKQSALEAVRTLRRDTDKVCEYVSDINSGIQKTKSMFTETDKEITRMATAASTGTGHEYGDNSGQTSVGKISLEGYARPLIGIDPKEAFDLGELGKKVIGAFGPIGTLISSAIAIYDGSKGGDWIDAGKEIAGGIVSWAQHFNTHKWMNFSKTNRFGHNWGTKNYAKRLLGLTCETSSKAAAWGNRVARNFKAGLEGTFRTFDPKAAGSGYKPNWFGIAGTAIDLGFSAYGNYKQVQAGEISGDRAVVETVAETAANVLLVTAAGAIAAATLPATAPAVAVTAAGAAIVWAADGVTKLVTGGDKGLAEVVSEGVGWAYDKGKEAGKKALEYGKDVASKAVDKAADFFGNLRKKAIGTSKAYCM